MRGCASERVKPSARSARVQSAPRNRRSTHTGTPNTHKERDCRQLTRYHILSARQGGDAEQGHILRTVPLPAPVALRSRDQNSSKTAAGCKGKRAAGEREAGEACAGTGTARERGAPATFFPSCKQAPQKARSCFPAASKPHNGEEGAFPPPFPTHSPLFRCTGQGRGKAGRGKSGRRAQDALQLERKVVLDIVVVPVVLPLLRVLCALLLLVPLCAWVLRDGVEGEGEVTERPGATVRPLEVWSPLEAEHGRHEGRANSSGRDERMVQRQHGHTPADSAMQRQREKEKSAHLNRCFSSARAERRPPER